MDLIIRAGNILRGFDEDARATLAVEMEKKGIRIRRDETVLSIERKPGSGYSLRLGSGEALETDMAMYATGRLPNTKNLGLEEVGVEMGPKGEIIVNDDYQSSVPNIFALGDVIDRMALTPVAIAEAARFVETQFNDNPQDSIIRIADSRFQPTARRRCRIVRRKCPAGLRYRCLCSVQAYEAHALGPGRKNHDEARRRQGHRPGARLSHGGCRRARNRAGLRCLKAGATKDNSTRPSAFTRRRRKN